MPYRSVAAQALAAWRNARARVEAAAVGSDEWRAAYLDEQLAKGRYQEAVDAAAREGMAQPPPFDDVAGHSVAEEDE